MGVTSAGDSVPSLSEDKIAKCNSMRFGITTEEMHAVFGEPMTAQSHLHSYWLSFRSNPGAAGDIKALADDHSEKIIFLQCQEDSAPVWDNRTPYQKEPPDFSKEPVLIKRVGNWEYRVHYLKRGTPDEGIIGVIYRDGKPFNPPRPESAHPFDPVETPLGRLRPVPESEDLDRPNFIGGWQYVDKPMWPFTSRAAKQKFAK
jgi:hypothetical protein